MHKDELASYGLEEMASVRIDGHKFLIEISKESIASSIGCIYAFVIDDEIVRVGSSAGPLKRRLAAWQSHVSRALAGGKSSTPLDEAERWRRALPPTSRGAVYARQAVTVTSPVGTFTAHLDEERTLIARHKPRLNRSWR